MTVPMGSDRSPFTGTPRCHSDAGGMLTAPCTNATHWPLPTDFPLKFCAFSELAMQGIGLVPVDPLNSVGTGLRATSFGSWSGVDLLCRLPRRLQKSYSSRPTGALGDKVKPVRCEQITEWSGGIVLVQPSKDHDKAAVVPIAHWLEHPDRPAANCLRHPQHFSGEDINRSQANASGAASHLCQNEMTRRVHPVPADGPQQIVLVVTRQPVSSIDSRRRSMNNGSDRITAELPFDRCRPSRA